MLKNNKYLAGVVMSCDLKNRLWFQYCVIVSAGCLVAASIGSILSGTTLIYLLAMVALTAPGVIKHILPPEWKRHIPQVLKSASAILVPPGELVILVFAPLNESD